MLLICCTTNSINDNDSGGRFCSFSPCIEQSQRCCEALQESGFVEIQSMEVLQIEDNVKTRNVPLLEFEFVKHKVSAISLTIWSFRFYFVLLFLLCRNRKIQTQKIRWKLHVKRRNMWRQSHRQLCLDTRATWHLPHCHRYSPDEQKYKLNECSRLQHSIAIKRQRFSRIIGGQEKSTKTKHQWTTEIHFQMEIKQFDRFETKLNVCAVSVVNCLFSYK